MNRSSTIAIASLLLLSTPAFAEEAADPATDAIDIAFGAALTSNYMFRSTSQTQDRPALQGYIEASYNIFYVGVWASNVRLGGVNDVEVDIYGGVRPEFGNLSLDLGFVQYIYQKDPTDYGDLYAKANYAFTDMFTGGVEYYHDPYNDWDWAALVAEVSGLPFEVSASGHLGTDFGSLQLGTDKVAWDAGLSRTFVDVVTLDLRYHDSNVDPARFVATLSVDTTLSALIGSGGN